jgi:hypothetical protein
MYTHKFNTQEDRNDYILSTGFTKPFVSTYGGGVVSYNKDADDMLYNGHDYVEIGGLK